MSNISACLVIGIFLLSSLLLNNSVAESQAGTIAIPENQDCIPEKEFYGNQEIQEVMLPEGIRIIEHLAFADSALEKINLPASIKHIAEDAFLDSDLEEVTVHAGSYSWKWIQSHPCSQRVVVQTTNWKEYSDAYHSMMQAYECIAKENEGEPFSTGRILVRVKDTLPDISIYQPVQIIIEEESHFVIQFSNPEDAKNCCDYLITQQEVLYAEEDSVMSI